MSVINRSRKSNSDWMSSALSYIDVCCGMRYDMGAAISRDLQNQRMKTVQMDILQTEDCVLNWANPERGIVTMSLYNEKLTQSLDVSGTDRIKNASITSIEGEVSDEANMKQHGPDYLEHERCQDKKMHRTKQLMECSARTVERSLPRIDG